MIKMKGQTMTNFSMQVSRIHLITIIPAIAMLVIVAMPQPLNAADLSTSQAIYEKNCKRCHELDGSGSKDGKPVSALKTLFKNSTLSADEQLALVNLLDEESKKFSDADMLKVLKDGKDKMPNYTEKFTKLKEKGELQPSVDETLKMMVDYVRHLQNSAVKK